MAKILVTGATGNVGRHVYEALKANNALVVGASSQPGRMDVMLDFNQASTYEAALSGVECVFLVRPPEMGRPQALLPFIEAMAAHSVKLVVFLSLIGIEKNPFPPHGKIEKALMKANLPYCFLRASFFMENLTGIHAFEIQHQNTIFIPAGRSSSSFVAAKDIGQAAARILTEPDQHRNKAYDITGPENLSYHEVAQCLSDVLGRPIHYASPSLRQAYGYWTKTRHLDKAYALVMCGLYLMTRLGAASYVSRDLGQLLSEAPTDFKTFVKEHGESWQTPTNSMK